MLSNIYVKNYKSIKELNIPLGRINILIGENGAGKSNILEAIALAGAASAKKLDNEFLASRGIRVTQPEFMRSAFPGYDDSGLIEISVESENLSRVTFRLSNDNKAYSSWKCEEEFVAKNDKLIPTDVQQWLKYSVTSSKADRKKRIKELDDFMDVMKLVIAESERVNKPGEDQIKDLVKLFQKSTRASKFKNNHFIKTITNGPEEINELRPYLNSFVVYSPENSSLRVFEEEGQIQPLGINGEGLLKLLNTMENIEDKGDIEAVKAGLKSLNWFDDLSIFERPEEYSMLVKDRFLDEARNIFDQRSANEGFLFLAFYLALFEAAITPDFFAVDNIDASLNPKLCQKLIEILSVRAKEKHKQAILTTHNPAILDGIDIFNDEHRLFVIERNKDGYTQCRRIGPPEGVTRQEWGSQYFGMKLSEIWMAGAIGGMPTDF